VISAVSTHAVDSLTALYPKNSSKSVLHAVNQAASSLYVGLNQLGDDVSVNVTVNVLSRTV
jgi:hypothetical protein